MKYTVKFTNRITGLVNQVENLDEKQMNRVVARADSWIYKVETFVQVELSDLLEEENEQPVKQ